MAGAQMDNGRRTDASNQVDGPADSADVSNANSSKHLDGQIPEGRRAVGRLIKSLALENDLTVTAFLHRKERSDDKGKFDKLIQGRKIIREPEAVFLVELFGGTIEFWMTLEHKILENPDISVPLSVALRQNSGSDRRFMSGTSNEFGFASGSDPALNGHFIVLDDGRDRTLIPKDLPPQLILELHHQWLAREKTDPNDTADLTVGGDAPAKG